MIVPMFQDVPAAGNCSDPAIILTSVNAGFSHANLGLRWLRANLAELQPACCILEGTRRLGVDRLVEAIAELAPRIIGISVSIWNHSESRQLMVRLRQSLPDSWIVVGGPEASYLPSHHALFDYADVLIRGEAELEFARLCRQLLSTSPAESARGYRPGGAALHEIQATVPDLSELTLPYSQLHDSDLAHRLVYIETSRGCPFRCEFCLSSVQGAVRTFPLEPVLAEIRSLYARGGRFFKVIDRTFNLDFERAYRTLSVFLELLSSGRNPDAYVQFEVVPDRLPIKLREILQQFPPDTLRLEVGIQTFNNQAAARINRKQDQQKSLENLQFLSSCTNATLHADLIIGLPGENLHSFAAGFDRLWAMKPGEIQLGILKALPGTTLRRHDQQWGMVWNPEPPYEIMATAAIPRAEMDELKIAAKYWELIVNRGRFPDQVHRLLPPHDGTFLRFLELSRWLYGRLGKTWGIDAAELGRLMAEY